MSAILEGRSASFSGLATSHNHPAAISSRIGLLRAKNEMLLQHAEARERYREACAASENPEGAAAWHRLANLARNEAHWFSFRADVLEDSAKHILEPKKCA